MKYFYFILAVYPQKTTGLPVFENILEFETSYLLDSSERLRLASDHVKNFLREPGAIIHSFQLIRTESDESNGVKIPDPTSWAAAPVWAMYKTMGADGEIKFWDAKPKQGVYTWISGKANECLYICTIADPRRYDWKKMIEARAK